MKNIGDMLKQAREMQGRMTELQSELENAEVSGESAAGMVRVTLSGKGELKAVRLDPSIIDPEDAGMLEDLIIAAHAVAKRRVEEMLQEKMRELTGGLPLPPGMNLPF